jgi:hypothetical protein
LLVLGFVFYYLRLKRLPVAIVIQASINESSATPS